jgi:hypothetical protein
VTTELRNWQKAENDFAWAKKTSNFNHSLVWFSPQHNNAPGIITVIMHSLVKPNAWVVLRLPSDTLKVLQVLPNT